MSSPRLRALPPPLPVPTHQQMLLPPLNLLSILVNFRRGVLQERHLMRAVRGSMLVGGIRIPSNHMSYISAQHHAKGVRRSYVLAWNEFMVLTHPHILI